MSGNNPSDIRFVPESPRPHAASIARKGLTIEAGRAPEAEFYEFCFQSDRHAVVLSRKGSRSRGTTSLDGAPRCGSLVFDDTCVVVPAGASMQGWSAPRDTHAYVVVTFDPKVQAGLDRKLAAAPLVPELCFKDPLLSAAGEALEQEILRPGGFGALRTDTLTHLVLVRLLTRHAGPALASGLIRGGLAPYQLRLVTDFMQDRLAEQVSLDELAALAGLSVSHFSRSFRVSTSLPPHAWLRPRRIERAKEMLRTTDLPLSTVSAACGFCDQPHFTRVFRDVTGSTPRAWRRGARA